MEDSSNVPEVISLPAQNMSIAINFTVHIENLRPWEYVFVVGSHSQLGEWAPEKALELKPDPENR
jgi:hypothetical protein